MSLNKTNCVVRLSLSITVVAHRPAHLIGGRQAVDDDRVRRGKVFQPADPVRCLFARMFGQPRGIAAHRVHRPQIVDAPVEEDIAGRDPDRGRDGFTLADPLAGRQNGRHALTLSALWQRFGDLAETRREFQKMVEAVHDPALVDEVEHVLDVAAFKIARATIENGIHRSDDF